MSKKIVIDSGHGGEDNGASGNGIIEKDLTLKISKYMKQRFDELGIPNQMTRTEDVTLNPNDRVKKVLSFYGDGKDVIVLSNHINAGGGDGFEIVYALRNNDTLARKITQEIENTGQNVRKYYQRRLPSNSAKDYYYIIRETPNTEALLVEYGFLDSTGDDVSQLKNNYEELAEAVVKAVASYAGVPYTSQTDEYYTVLKGDSLWSIANKFNTTVANLKSLNNLSSNLLQIGQKLKISATKVDQPNEYYTVKKGDTLYSIASSNNLTVQELKDLNNLTSNNLSIGQSLLIKKMPKENTNVTTYTVKSGDTLYSIAKKYNTTVNAITTLNNLTSNTLSIGQTLKIPTSTQNVTEQTYTVKSGDTLYSIARKYNTTVSDLINRNNLKTSNLSIGQKLIIPNHN